MNVVANGKPRPVEPGTTVGALIEALGLRPALVVIEHNGEPLDRSAAASTALAEGDRIEIVRAVAGG